MAMAQMAAGAEQKALLLSRMEKVIGCGPAESLVTEPAMETQYLAGEER